MNPPQIGEFCWNELITTDVAGSGAFYTKLFGWKQAPMDGVDGYQLFMQGETMAGGMMAAPAPGIPPHWLAYVMVADCDASTAEAVGLGAKVLAPPMDIPTVGRISVLQDPQGAVFGLFTPKRA
jgi:hypothetical protein